MSTPIPLSKRRLLSMISPRSKLGAFWQTMKRNPVTFAGALIIFLVVSSGLLAPIIAPYPIEKMVVVDRLKGPSLLHVMGTDKFGRDILSRVLFGARVSLVVGFGATFIASILGTIIGSVSAFAGSWTDEIVMRIMDIMLAFPYIVLAIVIVAVIGPGIINLIFIIGIVRIPQFARVARSSVLKIKLSEFVFAARSIGQTSPRILIRHILPNIVGPIIVLATLSMGTAIGAEATLSFLGLGIQPPMSSWGTMLSEGRSYMFDAPWMATFPGITISLTILGSNLVGDGLRDALDPTSRGR